MNSDVSALVQLNQAIDGVPSGWWMILAATVLFASGFIFRAKKIASRVKRQPKVQPPEREPFRRTLQTVFSASRYDRAEPRSDLERQWVLNYEWLVQFWIDEEVRHAAGQCPQASLWRFEPVGTTMTRTLADWGFPSDIEIKRRGKGYDVLGLCELPTLPQREQLVFFEVPLGQLNRTLAERKIRWLMESRANAKRWRRRPATGLQQVFFKIMGIGLEEDATATTADAAMAEIFEHFKGLNPTKFNDWYAFEGIYNELGRGQFGAKIETPMPDALALYEGFLALKAEGKTGLEQYIRPQMVLDKSNDLQAMRKAQGDHVRG